MTGFAAGGVAFPDGANLAIGGVPPTGLANGGNVIWSAVVTYGGDINASVRAASIPGATVVLSGDLSGTATDATGSATGITLTGDVTA